MLPQGLSNFAVKKMNPTKDTFWSFTIRDHQLERRYTNPLKTINKG